MKDLCRDLQDAYGELDDLVKDLSEEGWRMVTPFAGWTIKDQIGHLAYFDRAAYLSATDPAAFEKNMMEMLTGVTDFDQVHLKVLGEGRALTDPQLLSWWREERKRLLAAYERLPPDARLPWYSRSMSAKSSASARIMEVWAHGQDVFDALKVKRQATGRLKHIAHLGVSTFKWSFENRKMDLPDTPVRVELVGPNGEEWVWGPEDASERVNGLAEDFCLVVTQRRHPSDVGLETRGDAAALWLSIAQAFAGPPERGPEPGERVWEKTI